MKLIRLMAAFLALSMMFSTTACSEETSSGKIPDPPLPQEKPAEKPEVEPVPPVEESDEVLTTVYEIVDELNASCAVAYLGYTEGPLGDGYTGWFKETQMLDIYPFLEDISSDHIIEQEGGEVYCIIPRNEAVFITVHAQDFDYDGNVTVGEELFRSMNSEPFLIRGNISEIVPNTVVNIQYEDGSSIEFSPHLSGENGHLAIAEDQFILDISEYDDWDVGYEADWVYLNEEDIEGAWIANEVMYDEETILTCYLEFGLDEEGSNKVMYWYGYQNSDIIELFEGRYYEGDVPEELPRILFELTLTGGSALEDVEPYDSNGSFHIRYSPYGDVIEMIHLDGNPLLHGFEGQSIVFERSYG